MPSRSRRALLQLLGSGAAGLLAGCQADDPTATPTDAATPTATEPATPTPTDTATERDTPTATEGPAVDPDALRCSPPAPPAGWRLPRGSPGRLSFAPEWAGFDATPAVAWTAEAPTPEGVEDDPATSYGPPVVAGGTVYATNRLNRGPERPQHGRVEALDAAGEPRWTSDVLRSTSGPVVRGDLVVALAERDPSTPVVVAFDREDGTRRWTRAFDGNAFRLVPAGDRLVVTVEEPSDAGSVYALAPDGDTVWERAAAFDDHPNAGPAVGPSRVYVATRDGVLHALDRRDGATRWERRLDGVDPYVTDVVATGCAVAVVDDDLRAFTDDGQRAWTAADGEFGAVATDGETLYTGVYLGDGDAELRALDAGTGDRRWTVGGGVESFAAPVVAGDALYVPHDESIVALSRSDGSERWRAAGQLRHLALAGGTVYGVADRRLVALR